MDDVVKPNIYCFPLAQPKASSRATVATVMLCFCVYAKFIWSFQRVLVRPIKNYICR